MNRKHIFLSVLISICLLFSNCYHGGRPIHNKIKVPFNIILMIGDGMGLAQISAAAFINGGLSLELFKHLGLVKTTSADDYITDSAAGATAFSCGVKTYNGAIGIDQDSLPLISILELAEKHNLSTGLIATCSITHATPASFYAHTKSREFHAEIANQFYGKGIDYVAATGKPYFDMEKLKNDNYTVLTGKVHSNFDHVQKLLWFYNDSIHPPKSDFRGDWLSLACNQGIQHLSKNKNGFFLMVEGSQIDWAGHDNDFNYMVKELIDFDKAVKVALDYAKRHGNTLLIVTADHETGGLSLESGNKKDKSITSKFSSTHHSGIMVPIFAFGPGAELFTGTMENIEVFNKMKTLFDFE